jgi:hypothetical protein
MPWICDTIREANGSILRRTLRYCVCFRGPEVLTEWTEHQV